MKSVLLLGDSIRLGYCPFVREDLNDVAEVVYPEDNCRFTQYTFFHLKNWVDLVDDPKAIDVIHWNNGHWDVSHCDGAPESLNSPELYCQMLERIYKRLAGYCPNAKIIFATTTPMNPSGLQGGNIRTTEEIAAYNDAAFKTMARLGVPVNDLFSLMKECTADDYIDHAHFTKNSYRRLADAVTARVRDALA